MTVPGVTVPGVRELEVVRAGIRTTVQDRGRPGLAHLGVPRSGAADAPALALANRLVGNPPEAAGLEVTLSGCVLRPSTAMTMAVTGARGEVRVAGRPADHGVPLAVPAGAPVEIGPATAGLRRYLGVAGGITVPPVLGSRSTDTLSGLGPATVTDGLRLPVGPPVGWASVGPAVAADPPVRLELHLWLGPRDGWFTPAAIATLFSAEYRVSPLCDRVGVRLTGPVLTRSVAGELRSEGTVLGSVQITADGQPVVLLVDHPTTGGYPVVGVVDPSDVPAVAQARPGHPVRFVPA